MGLVCRYYHAGVQRVNRSPIRAIPIRLRWPPVSLFPELAFVQVWTFHLSDGSFEIEKLDVAIREAAPRRAEYEKGSDPFYA